MNQDDKKIGPLKNVVLALTVSGVDIDTDQGGDETRFDFIFGIGKEGLVPFETLLADRGEGDEVVLRLGGNDIHGIFQHLGSPFRGDPPGGKDFLMKIKILSVADAEPRAVIRAMAETAGCGCTCCDH